MDTFHAKPIEEVQEISAITYGFMASKALFAALEFDLFTHIARGTIRSARWYRQLVSRRTACRPC